MTQRIKITIGSVLIGNSQNILTTIPGMFFGYLLLPLHVEHQIAAGDELDDEEQMGIGLKGRGESIGILELLKLGSNLEAGVQSDQEGVVGGGLEDGLFRLDTVDVLNGVGDDGTVRLPPIGPPPPP